MATCSNWPERRCSSCSIDRCADGPLGCVQMPFPGKLFQFHRENAKKFLYRRQAARVASMLLLPCDPSQPDHERSKPTRQRQGESGNFMKVRVLGCSGAIGQDCRTTRWPTSLAALRRTKSTPFTSPIPSPPRRSSSWPRSSALTRQTPWASRWRMTSGGCGPGRRLICERL